MKKLKRLLVIISGTLAIFLNFFSLYWHNTNNFLAPTRETSIGTSLWIVSLFFWVISIFLISQPDQRQENKLNSPEKIILFAFLAFGLILRLYKINHFGLYVDEKYWINEAYGILEGSVRTPFGFIGDQPSNMPAYLVAFFLAIFKNVYLAVRLPGVLYSLLTTIFVFSFLREAFGKRTALISALFLSTSIWDIHMTQLGWNNVNLNPFLISGVIFFLYRGVKLLAVRNMLICGLLLGVSVNLLYIAALEVLVVSLYFTYQLIINPSRKKLILLLGVLLVSVFITCSPTIIKVKKYPELSIKRHQEFINQNVKFSQTGSRLTYYLNQTALGAKDFTYKKGGVMINGLWGVTLDSVVSLLLFAGLLYSLAKFFRPAQFLVMANYFTMFIPIVILYRFTSVWREYGFLPMIYMLSAIGLIFFSQLLSKLLHALLGNKIKVDFQKIILAVTIVIYAVSWINIYGRYYQSHLKIKPEIVESYCQEIAQYIEKNTSTDLIVAIPNDFCRDLTETTFYKKRKLIAYANSADLLNYLNTDKFIIIYSNKEIIPSGVVSAAEEIDFILQNQGVPYEKRVILGNLGKIYAHVYVSI